VEIVWILIFRIHLWKPFYSPPLSQNIRQQLWTIVRTKPQFLNMYLGLCAAGEHFCEYRALARERITQQLRYDPLIKTTSPEREPTLVGA
jgi:hypothetical protein